VTEAIAATVAVVDAQLRYRFVNGAFERSCGLAREQILGRTATQILGDVEFERRQPWMQRALAGDAVDFSLDYLTREAPVHLAVSHVPLRAESGEVDGIVIVTQDVTRQKREEARLLELALRDPLTGLLNRAGFERGLGLLRQQVDHTGLAVLYIDLDNFKPVNDQHGHPVGDLVLEHFAKRLAALVRPSDLVARLGGDEFAVALAGMRQPAHAQAVAEKVLVAVHTPFKAGDVLVKIGASVGIAFSNDAEPAWRELLGIADAELLKAKAAGKGRQSGAGARQTGHPSEQDGQ
jgi:diguanylate cyclase (GGDEF)-like protein/PAS domain S-box-containing protein